MGHQHGPRSGRVLRSLPVPRRRMIPRYVSTRGTLYGGKSGVQIVLVRDYEGRGQTQKKFREPLLHQRKPNVALPEIVTRQDKLLTIDTNANPFLKGLLHPEIRVHPLML